MEKRLYRSRTDRMIGGVCGGLGRYFNVDPSLIRLAFVLLLVFGGSGFLLYVILWVILPEEGRSYASQEEISRSNTQEIAERAKQFGQDVKTAFGGPATDASGQPLASDTTGGMPSEPARRSSTSGAWVIGLVMIVLGGLFLLDNLTAFSFGQMWPLVLILIGAVMLYNQFRK